MKSLVVFGFLFVCVVARGNTERDTNVPLPSDRVEVIGDVINKIEDEDKGIERPCPSLDSHCIRRFLHEHSHCKMTYGPVPDPLYRAQVTQNLPRINFTVTAKDVEYRRLNGRIEEFYVNRKTDQVVLAVEFNDVQLSTNNGFYFFYRRAKEPVITNDFYNITYSSVIVTAIIPHINNLRYDKSEQFTYSNDPTSRFVVGPNTFKHRDPVVQRVFLALVQNLPVNVRELLLTDGPFFMASFIQYSLCDFGLKLI